MVERRKYPRFKIAHDVCFGDASVVSKIRSEGRTQTEDVSRGGVRMKINAPVESGKVLSLKIYNKSYADPINADATVIWAKKLMNNTSMLGLSFVRIGWIESDKLFTPQMVKEVA